MFYGFLLLTVYGHSGQQGHSGPEVPVRDRYGLYLLFPVLKDVLDRDAEGVGDLEGEGEGRHVLSGFDGDYSLAG